MWELLSKGLSDIAGGAFKLIDDLHTSDAEKAEIKLKMQTLMLEQQKQQFVAYQQEVESRANIIQAEMNQEDRFTKRARPATMYMFLAIITLNYCVFPAISHFTGIATPDFKLPQEAWDVFEIVFSVYAVGRTVETKIVNKISDALKKTK